MVAMSTNDDGQDVMQGHHVGQKQRKEMQHHRSIWGRLAIAEIPYPVIAADDVVISLYANRLMLRVASSAFTVTVFHRDITRIVLFAEENSIEMQVARVDGAHRMYVVEFQEPRAALMMYDVMLPLLPSEVKDGLSRDAARSSLYTTDHPFSLLSPGMMVEAGFYELHQRCGTQASGMTLKRRSAPSRPYFPPKQRFLLSSQGPALVSTRRSLQQEQQEEVNLKASSSLEGWPPPPPPPPPPQTTEMAPVPPGDASGVISAAAAAVAPRCEASCPIERDRRGTDALWMSTLQGRGMFPVEGGKFMDEPYLVTYDVETGEQIHDGEYVRLLATPLSWHCGMPVESVTPVSHCPSLSRSPYDNPAAAWLKESASGDRQDVAHPAALRIGATGVTSASRSISMCSHRSGVDTSFFPLRMPRHASSLVSSNGHMFNSKIRSAFAGES